MHKSKEIKKLFNEDVDPKSDCALCKESKCKIGQKCGYGTVIYRIGNSKNGWFATLSPKTGGNPKFDFTIQLMPNSHLTHFSQISSYPILAENFGILFAKICRAMTTILMQQQDLKADSENKEFSVPIGAYGKCTTWREKKEHLHIKVFPFRSSIGQPYTVDSSFGKKEIFKEKTGKEFVKMEPVKKIKIETRRFDKLTTDIIKSLEK